MTFCSWHLLGQTSGSLSEFGSVMLWRRLPLLHQYGINIVGSGNYHFLSSGFHPEQHEIISRIQISHCISWYTCEFQHTLIESSMIACWKHIRNRNENAKPLMLRTSANFPAHFMSSSLRWSSVSVPAFSASFVTLLWWRTMVPSPVQMTYLSNGMKCDRSNFALENQLDVSNVFEFLTQRPPSA